MARGASDPRSAGARPSPRGGPRCAWLVLLSLVAAAPLAPPLAHAAVDRDAGAAAPASSALPELPRLAPIARPEPDITAVRELDRVLDQITSQDARARENARAALDEPISGIVDAVRLRVQDIRGSIDRDAAPRALAEARREGRKALKGDKGGDDAPDGKKKGAEAKDDKGAKKGAGDAKKGDAKKGGDAKDKKDARDDKGAKKGGDAKDAKKDAKADQGAKKGAGDEKDDAEGDWLDFMLATPRPRDSAWRDVVKLLAMVRMLAADGTTPAVRELIALHAYFGELLRIDLQRQVAKLRDKAVPALIEARQHDAKIVQRWANKQLDLLGRAIPGEAIASNDTQILADVLRAYGRVRDVDAMRVILSFCNSDRARLRDAAREAIAAIGEPGVWQLRDAYLNLTGEKPPREWSWDRIARELFATYDRARLAEVYKLMDEGVAAASANKLAEATDAFDRVLARAPLFERRKEMVGPYVERARSMPADQREDALAMLRKALRLDPTGEQAPKIEAEIAYLEGALLIDRGTPDKFVLERVIELDPGHAGARAALASLGDKVAERKSQKNRYIAAGAVGFAALLAMFFIARRRSDPAPSAKQPSAAPPQPPASLGAEPPRAQASAAPQPPAPPAPAASPTQDSAPPRQAMASSDPALSPGRDSAPPRQAMASSDPAPSARQDGEAVAPSDPALSASASEASPALPVQPIEPAEPRDEGAPEAGTPSR
ncbi:tetratricopeptide repeat protein [Sorangium sp. So ce385]|uniref:tetratricopeptide repeat protein n=1 Tax=Sorangium sp. So ce385 TaxID=3133308 RepID=UPI003F5B726D